MPVMRGTQQLLLRALAVLTVALPGCVTTRYRVEQRPDPPFDAVVVPGCPSDDDGSPTFCQLGRAGQAALLWRDGWTRSFIVSGSDVHTPYVEAEAIAEQMTVLGVPAGQILLEPDALHSDENIYYSLIIARAKGLERLAVASNGPIASMLCEMMVQWGHPCSALALDIGALRKFMPAHDAELRVLRAARTKSWEPLAEREARIAKVNGYTRPVSWFLYAFYGSLGPKHRPIAPAHTTVKTWEERRAELAGAATTAP